MSNSLKPIARPGYGGVNQTQVKLWVNYFEIRWLGSIALYRYQAFLDKRRRLNDTFRALELDRFLRKVRVQISYLMEGDHLFTSVKTIHLVVEEQGKSALESTIVKLYVAHNINLLKREQIVVDVGTKGKAVYIPAELCHVVSGQATRHRLSARQTSDMIRVACCRPRPNANAIVKRGLPLMGMASEANGIKRPEDFGIQVARNMLAVAGSILLPPQLVYKYPLKVTKPGSWNLLKNVAFNQLGFFCPDRGVGCLVITHSPGRDTPETAKFMAELGQHMINYGVNWPVEQISTDAIKLTRSEKENE
ncbi:hypothetical protein MaudCBS49596_004344 [Microsporum audouinii]